LSDVLKDVQIFDVYRGKEITDDMVSIAVACIFQDSNKTLVEQDILSYQGAILKVLTEKFSIKLRDGQ
jgi:phenylalanyl-tRNA synthetase beta chain